MANDVETIIEKIRALEQELEAEFARRNAGLRFGLEHGRAKFEAEVTARHQALKVGLARYLGSARPVVVLVSPIIYSMIIPFVLLDLWVSVYQAVCFPAYRIPQVKRGRYMIFDRSGLAYLNIVQKVNCAYCSYGNGVIAYAREIAARTEQYWCPIKHARRALGAHPRYAAFADYGDVDDFQTSQARLREALRAEPDEKP